MVLIRVSGAVKDLLNLALSAGEERSFRLAGFGPKYRVIDYRL
jgi:hypothetical protein